MDNYNYEQPASSGKKLLFSLIIILVILAILEVTRIINITGIFGKYYFIVSNSGRRWNWGGPGNFWMNSVLASDPKNEFQQFEIVEFESYVEIFCKADESRSKVYWDTDHTSGTYLLTTIGKNKQLSSQNSKFRKITNADGSVSFAPLGLINGAQDPFARVYIMHGTASWGDVNSIRAQDDFAKITDPKLVKESLFKLVKVNVFNS